MRMRKHFFLGVALCLVAAGCSDVPESPAEPGERRVAQDGSGGGEAPDPSRSAPKARAGKAGGEPGRGRKGHGDPSGGPSAGEDEGTKRARPGSRGAGRKGSGGKDPETKAGGGSGSGESGEGGGSTSARAPFAGYPAPGTYVYGRSGYREFCGGTSCDREPLSPRHEVETRLVRRSSSAAVLVSEEEEQDAYFKTRTRYTGRGAFVEQVVSRFSYGAFEFGNTYDPRPPVETLRFPLKVGRRWSGSWEADVSGEYRATVTARENVILPEGAMRTFRIVTVTDFHGEFEGRSRVTAWIDPSERTLVRSVGKARLRNSFGSYETRFSILLRSSPGR